MGIEYEDDKMNEILRISKENNKMLHSMRRNAWLGGIFKILMWAAFILVPIWLYMQYVAPIMQGMLESYQELQGTSAEAKAQFSKMNEYLTQLQNLSPFGKVQ